MKRIAVFTLLLLCGITLFAGPFGLEMGWTRQDLTENNVKILVDEGNSLMVEPPSPHSSFDAYLLSIDSEFGLYSIYAFSDSISTSENGQQFLSKYNHIKEQLISSYGEPTKDINYLSYGSIWDEPQDFMMSLIKQDRLLGCIWELDENNGNMTVSLIPRAESLSSGFLAIMYHSSNYDEIQAREEAKEASVL